MPQFGNSLVTCNHSLLSIFPCSQQEYTRVQALGENSTAIPYKVNHTQTTGSSDPMPSCLSERNRNTCLYQERMSVPCAQMFIGALFTKVKTWEQPRCPSAGEQDKLRYIHTMEYISAIKGSNYWNMQRCGWINKTTAIGRKQTKKHTGMIPFMWISRTSKSNLWL